MDKLENIFKKSLENAEAPYDAKAWDSMASRLDKVMPVTNPKGSFKWAWVAGVVLIAGSAALIFVNQDTKSIDKTEFAQNKTENANKELTKSTDEVNSNKQGTLITTSNPEAVNGGTTIDPSKMEETNVAGNKKVIQTANISEKLTTDNSEKNTQVNLVEKVKETEIVKSIKEVKVIASEEKIVKEVISSKIDFSVSNETFYEKGLPINTLTCSIEAKKYEWTNERGVILSTEKNADIHLFTAGTHQITLTIINLNGKKQSITKPVRCEVNYNLLAVTGFNPASSDYRNNTFLPFALLKSERNIGFEMQIMDAKTGQVIFETKNADLPWDGMDRRTNQMVPVNSTYIWRVNIQEKAVGEPTNRYQGTITRI